jgi:hypothetical protein
MPLILQIEFDAKEQVQSPVFGMAIHRNDGLHITGPNTSNVGLKLPEVNGRGTVTFSIPHLSLLDGLYEISVAVVDQEDTQVFDYHNRAYPFRVMNVNSPVSERYGMMTLQGNWKYEL